jgi:rfaE bifunctional protein kinase chain/domain
MNAARFKAITERYRQLRIAVVGDFCLDRYLEIDPARTETSIETGLEVYNVARVRSQPGAAGTIVNNLVALEIGEIYAVGFSGDDGEGFELRRALQSLAGVKLDHFITTAECRTFTYCKPLVIEPSGPPRELNRLDSKNWSPTPLELQRELAARIAKLAPQVDAFIVMDQVDEPETGAATNLVCQAVHLATRERPSLVTLGDSRRGVQHLPPMGMKMNAAELARLSGAAHSGIDDVRCQAEALSKSSGQTVFVTLAEQGIVGAMVGNTAEHVGAHPVRGPIDIVGAGDSVTANLTSALAAGANVREAMELAMAGASIVIHQLGTTGVASVADLAKMLG